MTDPFPPGVRPPAAPDGAAVGPPGPRADAVARALFDSAVSHLQAGRLDAAEQAFLRVLRVLPSHASSWLNVGVLRHHAGRPVAGLAAVWRALQVDPAVAETPGLDLPRLFRVAHAAAVAEGESHAAATTARRWLACCPDDRRARGAAAMAALADPSLPAERAAAILAATPARDRISDPTLRHAEALLALRRGDAAAATRAARAAVSLAPPYADAWATLGTIALRHRDGEGAADPLRRALHLVPAHPGALLSLAALRLAEGHADTAARLALRVPPAIRHAPAHIGDLLSILHHAPGIDPDRLAAERAAWAAGCRPAEAPLPPGASPPPPPPPLRVVYLGDLGRPQVAALALPAILAHDTRPTDTAAPGLPVHAALVHASPPDRAPAAPPEQAARGSLSVVAGSDPVALAAHVRALAPHVLVLLTPTTLPQALDLLTRERPAPVQVLWGDVFGPVGLPGIDAVLTDAHHVTDPARPRFPGQPVSASGDARGTTHHDVLSERPVLLPHGAYLFAPPQSAPDPGPPPCGADGPITFGSFNRMDKLNDPLLARWGRILAALPDARMLIQARALDRPSVRADLIARLTAQGLDPARVRLEGGRTRDGMQALYRQADIALDSDPWSGGLTVLELLWMGVPVVTLAGAHACGRHAVSHLRRCGLDAWVTESPTAYVDRAVAAARDRSGLATLRASLRARLAGLPLCDPGAYARQLEDALAQLWRQRSASP